MKPFEKIMKRPALPNYYRQRHFQWPDTLPEIFDYLRQHDERPFLYGGDNWPYDAMCEWQRWPCGRSTTRAVSWTPAAARGSSRGR